MHAKRSPSVIRFAALIFGFHIKRNANGVTAYEANFSICPSATTAASAPDVSYRIAPHATTFLSRSKDLRKTHMLNPDTISVRAIITRTPISAPNSKNIGMYHGLKTSDDGSPNTGTPKPMYGFQVRNFCGWVNAFMANCAIGS